VWVWKKLLPSSKTDPSNGHSKRKTVRKRNKSDHATNNRNTCTLTVFNPRSARGDASLKRTSNPSLYIVHGEQEERVRGRLLALLGRICEEPINNTTSIRNTHAVRRSFRIKGVSSIMVSGGNLTNCVTGYSMGSKSGNRMRGRC